MSLTVTKRNRRKIRAILAAGLVLGVGAAVTLAAWSDSVWGQSEFATDKWNVQGSFNGGTSWGEFATGPTAGTFTFPLADATSLTPGESVKAPVSLRVGPAECIGDPCSIGQHICVGRRTRTHRHRGRQLQRRGYHARRLAGRWKRGDGRRKHPDHPQRRHDPAALLFHCDAAGRRGAARYVDYRAGSLGVQGNQRRTIGICRPPGQWFIAEPRRPGSPDLLRFRVVKSGNL